MYGALFMMAGAYALSQDAHVRGDVLYRLFPKRTQATIDLILYILFLAPGGLALLYYGYWFASDSWFYKEVSWSSPSRIQIYFFKSLIPVSRALILMLGFAESVCGVVCIKPGDCRPRLHDVRERQTLLLHERQRLR